MKIEKIFLESWVQSTRKDERFGVYSAILKRIEIANNANDALTTIQYDDAKIAKLFLLIILWFAIC